jgi:hypothetical protein
MKCKTARTGLATLFAVALIVSMSAFAQAEEHECSLTRSAGKWSFTDNGTVVGIGPRAAAGVFTLDGKGSLLNGVAVSSLNGSVASETVSGTYTVNSDCSGTFDVKIYAAGTELFELTAFIAFDDNMRELRGVFTSVVAPNGASLATVINIEARKQ